MVNMAFIFSFLLTMCGVWLLLDKHSFHPRFPAGEEWLALTFFLEDEHGIPPLFLADEEWCVLTFVLDGEYGLHPQFHVGVEWLAWSVGFLSVFNSPLQFQGLLWFWPCVSLKNFSLYLSIFVAF